MTELETKIAEARCEAGREMYLAHADDYNKGFEQGVLTLLDMCWIDSSKHNEYSLPLYIMHRDLRVSRILRQFQREANKKKPTSHRETTKDSD